MSDNSFPISDNLSLINADNGAVYDVDKTFLENDILNGAKIILI